MVEKALSVSSLVGGAECPAAATWLVDSSTAKGPRTTFRRVLYLRFPLCGPVSRIVFDEQATQLEGVFLPLDFAVAESYPSSSVQQRGRGVRVQLQAPRQVVELRLPPTPAFSERAIFGLHRTDGDAVSEQPTTILESGASLQTMESLDLQNLIPDVAPRRSGNVGVAAGDLMAQQTEPRLTPADEFIGAEFEIRPAGPPEEQVALSEADVHGLRLRGFPTGPRLGIALPTDLSAPSFFWQVPGEVGRGTPEGAGRVTAGQALARELNRTLQRHPLCTCEHLDLALVIESDAPCRFRLDELQLPHHFEVDLQIEGSGNFVLPQSDPARDKEVIRFPGDSLTVETRTLQVPSGVELVEARLEVATSFGNERMVGYGTGDTIAPDTTPPGGTARGGKSGILLTPDHTVGQWINSGQSPNLRGFLLEVMALTKGTELVAHLESDADGTPSGRKLGETSILLTEAGKKRWVAVRFPSLAQPAPPFWLLLRTSTGRGVWRTEPHSGNVHLLERSEPRAPRKLAAVHPGLTGAYRVLASDGSATRNPGPSSLGEPPPLVVSLGGLPVAPETPVNGRIFYALRPLLAPLVDAATPGETIQIPVAFSTATPGFLTLFPPTIRFQIPG